ncbi:cobalt-precorrin-6A reductase [Maribius pontilimi]|uniref:Cobalt-precorrin-6A reductase n=1 Tax=Palleronia pontilimi TaxID=1964209 RepID=A0A934II76_9RHOB|nr:cobalt-precorrin-6A reductase [Palleronia pontilimi]MBJ3763512.1 cobalt-precorrin-6A reductase [Palleronia pontilimi]
MRLLLLAGTTEARQLASALGGRQDFRVTASLAGATRAPQPLGVPTRIGGFGGREGFAEYLRHERIGAVLDATHPFAASISHRSSEVCAELDVPYAQILRPSWRPLDGDRWEFLNDETDATRFIEADATVFLATGRQTLDRFAPLADRTIYARQIDSAPDSFPFPNGGWVIGRPPFTVDDEVRLFERLGVDWLVVKNAGGSASRSKLDAARLLGIRVAMIRRPMQPDALKLETVAAAITWARRLA